MSLLQMSISAGLLIAVIAVIRMVALNRLPKTMFLALWGVVLLRLLVPAAIPIALPINANIAVISIAETVAPTVSVSSEIADSIQSQSRYIAAVIWAVGMVFAFIFFAVIYIKNHKKLRFATRLNHNKFLTDWLSDNKLRRPITIMVSDRINTPLAVGIFRHKIILPRSMDMENTQLLNYVLSHEYHHIKRFDALWKLLLVFALCVHWFNPLVWVMFVLVNRDLELTCDETVIRRYGIGTRTDYAYTLIHLAETQKNFTPLYNGFNKNATEERIISIMKTKKKSLASVLVACMFTAVLTACGMVSFSAAEASMESEFLPEVLATVEYGVVAASIKPPSNQYYAAAYVDQTFELSANIVVNDTGGSAIIVNIQSDNMVTSGQIILEGRLAVLEQDSYTIEILPLRTTP